MRNAPSRHLPTVNRSVLFEFIVALRFLEDIHSGPHPPTPAQMELYNVAYEQVHNNMNVIKPGISFLESADKAWDIPAKYHANRFYLSAHGRGMTGDCSYLYHRSDFPDTDHDVVIEPGMTLCVKSYIGEEGGAEGVKLEQQIW